MPPVIAEIDVVPNAAAPVREVGSAHEARARELWNQRAKLRRKIRKLTEALMRVEQELSALVRESKEVRP